MYKEKQITRKNALLFIRQYRRRKLGKLQIRDIVFISILIFITAGMLINLFCPVDCPAFFFPRSPQMIDNIYTVENVK